MQQRVMDSRREPKQRGYEDGGLNGDGGGGVWAYDLRGLDK